MQYVKKQLGGEVHVVFDSYLSVPTTKDPAHAGRIKGTGIGPEIQFTFASPLTVSKPIFLSHLRNKQAFIELLAKNLAKIGIHIVHATDDADLLISTTDVEFSKTMHFLPL